MGGVDFTKRIIDFTVKDIRRKITNWNPDENSLHILRVACELAKLTLASDERAKIDAKSLTSENGLFNHIKNITRDQFNQINKDLFDKAIEKVDEAIENAKGNITIAHIDDVILVGGSTRIVKIREMLRDKIPAATIHSNIDPDLAG